MLPLFWTVMLIRALIEYFRHPFYTRKYYKLEINPFWDITDALEASAYMLLFDGLIAFVTLFLWRIVL
jgi:hypothetical protein